jgi:hypothetical protein
MDNFKPTLGKYGVMGGVDLADLEQVLISYFCEHGNEFSDSVGTEFLD